MNIAQGVGPSRRPAPALYFLAALFLWCSVFPAQGMEAGQGTPLFADSTTLAVTLIAPWRSFLRDGDSDSRYPAILEYRDVDGELRRLPVTVERRGITRREICRFPPLRVRFDRAATAGTLFEGQRSLKLVTHCGSSRRDEQYYVLESLAYRIHDLVTERNFRTRALTITYLDEERGRADADRFAFLIEHARDVARRNRMERIRVGLIRPEDYDEAEISRFMLFQYLIGNTDFSVWTASEDERCCHNMRVIKNPGEDKLYPVPYDFDSAGLVSAPYAEPHESLPIRHVRQRHYRGFCQHNASVETIRLEYLALETEILTLVANEPLLTSRNRNRALRYLGNFFRTLDDPDRFARQITSRCRR